MPDRPGTWLTPRLLRVLRAARVSLAVAVGLWALARCAAYLPHTRDGDVRQLLWIDTLIPLEAWATVWGAAGTACLIGAVVPAALRAGIVVLVGLSAAWTYSFVLAWLDGSARAWVTASTFAMITAVLWSALMALSILEPIRAAAHAAHLARSADEEAA